MSLLESCACLCHSVPGIVHDVTPCCDVPPMGGTAIGFVPEPLVEASVVSEEVLGEVVDETV